jgi:hypothetical protein
MTESGKCRIQELKGTTCYYLEINLCLLIPSCPIFVSSVDRNSSFAAAPSGPATFLCFQLGPFQSFSLLILEVSGKRTCNPAGGCMLPAGYFSIQSVAAAQDHRSFDNVLQLADISRPFVHYTAQRIVVDPAVCAGFSA